MSAPTSASLPGEAGYDAIVGLREAGRYAEAEQALAPWLAAHPQDLRALALLAHLGLLQGRTAEARKVYERAMAIAPLAGPVQRTLARLEMFGGRDESAVAAARAACSAEPGEPENLLVSAMALARTGAFDEALALADQVLAEGPPKAEAHVVRMQAATRRGRAEDAVAAGEAALRLKPHLPLWASLGALYMALGRNDQATEALRRGVALNPRDVQALINLGEAERRKGRLEAAAEPLRRATELDPSNAAAWGNLGAVLQQQGRNQAAHEAYGRALAIEPDAAAVLVNLGRLFVDEGRYDAAEQSCRRAIALQPRLAVGPYALAGVLRATGRLREAEAAYRDALALQPGFVEAELGLCDALLEQMQPAAARELLEDLLARNSNLEVFLRARLNLPVIPGSTVEMAEERARFAQAIEDARAWPGKVADPTRIVSGSWFYLAYHGLDDRPLMTALDRLFAEKAPALTHIAPGLASRRRAAGRRIRVGFVSQFLYNHTVGRLYRGFIRDLDRSRFEVTVAHLPKTRHDAGRAEISGDADLAIDLPVSIADQRALLSEAGLDVLFYTDIGMAPASYALARSRLAPVQAVGWGHPDTTGLSSLDYFVSADAVEPPGAEAAYAERLVRLDRLPCFYGAILAPAARSRAELGLPASGTLYGCPQSLFKIHPDFDPVLAEIVRRDPDARLVFLEGLAPEWAEALRTRWSRFPELVARAVFLPRVPSTDFLSLLAVMDVLLDPPHFGSGNTLYEAMAVGTPVVTWPGAFARGRIVAGAYAQMGVGEELVVDRLKDYAARAVEVARSGPRHAALSAALKSAAAEGLLADRLALRSFETFLAEAVAAADRGEVLPTGWRPEAAR